MIEDPPDTRGAARWAGDADAILRRILERPRADDARGRTGCVMGLVEAIRAKLTPQRRPADPGEPVRQPPTISVVVPFRDVEVYIADCLESVLAQTGVDIEVVLVDDGSTDASRRIAEELTAGRSDVRLTDSGGRGPGVARNAGVALARGEYLTFVDSDDRLPPGALRLLLESARENAADIVMGGFSRFTSQRQWHPRWVGDVHAVARQGVTVAEFPAALRNNYGCGKVFRRSFWDAQRLTFEETAIYEDQPLIGRLLWRASRLNILDQVVYDYRLREDRSSVSQRPEELRDLQARVAAWRRTMDALQQDKQPDSVIGGWYRTLYRTHFHWYLNSPGLQDPSYWGVLREAYRELKEAAPPGLLESLHPAQRVPLLLLDEDRHEEACALQRDGLGPGVRTPSGQVRVDPAELPERFANYQADPYLIGPESFTIDASVVRAGWRPGHVPCLELQVGLRSADQLPDLQPVLELRWADGGTHRVNLSGCTESELAALRPHLGLQYLGGCLVDQWRSSTGPVTVWLTLDGAEVPVTGLLSAGGAGELGTTAGGDAGELQLTRGPNNRAPVRVTTSIPKLFLTSVEVNGRTVQLAAAGLPPRTLELRSSAGEVVTGRFTKPGSQATVSVELPRTESREHVVSWSVLVETEAGRVIGLKWPAGRADPVGYLHDGPLLALSTAGGSLKLEEYPLGVLLAHDVEMGEIIGTLIVGQSESPFRVLASAVDERGTVPCPGNEKTRYPMIASPSMLARLPIPQPDGSLLVRRKPRRVGRVTTPLTSLSQGVS